MFIIIGNCISFGAALFMVASCIVKQRHRVFQLQFIQCMLLTVASYFFQSYSGLIANFISGIRNILVAKGWFTKRIMILFLLISIVLGFVFNNRGWIGLLPIIANIQFAICCYTFTSLLGTKYSIWVNVVLWIIYSFLIFDFATGISDSVVLIVNSISIWKIQFTKKEKGIKVGVATFSE